MPLPTPQPDESQDDFMSRCIEWMLDNEEAEDVDQATAICATQWEDAQSENEEEGKMIRKQFSIQVKEAREDGGVIAINTISVDRDKDRVLPIGAQIGDYMKNPVVQWGHNYSDPWSTIGRTNSLDIGSKEIVADFTLRPAANENDPQNVVRLLWSGGWVNAASVGFVSSREDMEENEYGGFDFLQWQLLEWSLVPIPANQDALRRMVKAFGDEPEGAAEVIELECLACGEPYQWSRTLAALVLSGKVPQVCANCSADLSEGLRELQGGVLIDVTRETDEGDEGDEPEPEPEPEQRWIDADAEAEIRGMLDAKAGRVDTIRDVLGADEVDEDAGWEIVDILLADNEANDAIIDLLGLESDDDDEGESRGADPEDLEEPAPADDGGEPELDDGDEEQRSAEVEASNDDDDELPPETIEALSAAISELKARSR